MTRGKRTLATMLGVLILAGSGTLAESARVRHVRVTCRDGEVRCDADGACDGACRFAFCGDAPCAETVDVTVPLRGGRKASRRVLRADGTKLVLKCLPPRGTCAPAVTTTTSPGAPPTTTTLPSSACTATLSGAVDAVVPCAASLSGGVLLPVFRLAMQGGGVDGAAGALLVGRGTGVYRLGERMILVAAGVRVPDPVRYQAVPGETGAAGELRLDDVSADVHGSLDATLPGVSGGAALRIQATF